MTTPPNGSAPAAPTQLPPADPGNPSLAPGPAMLTISNVRIAGPEVRDTGDRVLATIRTPSTTLTVFLPREDAEQWAAALSAAARNCSPLVLPK